MSVECTNAGCVSPDEYLRRLGHPEVRPGGEVEVSDGAHRVAPHHPELVNVPVRVVGLVQDGHLHTHTQHSVVVITRRVKIDGAHFKDD